MKHLFGARVCGHRSVIHAIALACVVSLISSTGYTAADEQVWSFGIVPQQSAKQLAQNWTPVMMHLSERTGIQLRFVTAKDIPTFEERLLNGEYDLAYMNPYHYTVFHEKPGYQAFAKQADKRIIGLLVVQNDSPIESIQGLQGATIAFPSPAAFAASVLPRAKLQQEGIKFTPRYVASHDSVYITVSKGLFPAGGGIERTLRNTPGEVQQALRVLWQTPGYTPHAFASHPRVPAQIGEKISNAMIQMHEDIDGKAALAGINFKAIELAKNEDWDDVRQLNIELLNPLLDETLNR